MSQLECIPTRFGRSNLHEGAFLVLGAEGIALSADDQLITLKPSVLRLGGNNGEAEVFGKEWGHDTLDDVENAVIIFPFAAFAN
jgi:hypothetical protein